MHSAQRWAEKLKREYDLSVVSLQSIWYGRNESLFGSYEERQALLEYTKRAIDFACAVGAKNIVFGCPKNRNIEDGWKLSKQQIIDYLNYVYVNIKKWENDYEAKKYKAIADKYEIESIISQLELCLVEFDSLSPIEGISYSIFQIGKIISDLMKESDKSGR